MPSVLQIRLVCRQQMVCPAVELTCVKFSRYQSADVGNFLSMSLLESQYHYQTSIEESVVVIYDTKKSARGFLTLKAYRLTPQVIDVPVSSGRKEPFRGALLISSQHWFERTSDTTSSS